MTKRLTLTLRLDEKIKALLVKRAAEEHRSLTSYIERLVLKDEERAKRQRLPSV